MREDLIERTRLAAQILRDVGGQSALATTVDEAADALEAAELRETQMHDAMRQATERLAAVARECEGLRRDAERYRHLRSNESSGSVDLCICRVERSYKSGACRTRYQVLAEERADAAIDQARGKGGCGEGVGNG